MNAVTCCTERGISTKKWCYCARTCARTHSYACGKRFNIDRLESCFASYCFLYPWNLFYHFYLLFFPFFRTLFILHLAIHNESDNHAWTNRKPYIFYSFSFGLIIHFHSGIWAIRSHAYWDLTESHTYHSMNVLEICLICIPESVWVKLPKVTQANICFELPIEYRPKHRHSHIIFIQFHSHLTVTEPSKVFYEYTASNRSQSAWLKILDSLSLTISVSIETKTVY